MVILRDVVGEVPVEGGGDDAGMSVGVREADVLAVVLRRLGSPPLEAASEEAPSCPRGHGGGGGGGGRPALTLTGAVASQEHPRTGKPKEYLGGCVGCCAVSS